MTYKGKWEVGVEYTEGNIVFIRKNKKNVYFVCDITHVSCDLVYPSDSDIYWTKINYYPPRGRPKKASKITLPRAESEPPKAPTKETPPEVPETSEDREDQDDPETPAAPLLPHLIFETSDFQKTLNDLLNTLDGLNNVLDNEIEKDILDNENEKDVKSFDSKTEPLPVILSEEELKAKHERDQLKRKISTIEKDLAVYRESKKQTHGLTITERILLLDIDQDTKIYLLDKYDNIKRNCSGSEYAKGMTWMNTVLGLPFNKTVPFGVELSDSKETIATFFERVKGDLDESIHGLDYVKEEIMEFLARKITDTSSKGHVLALQGSPGTAKTKSLKTLAKALNLPFYQINCGGLNDVAVLTGHSETYLGAKPGKLVEILTSAGCMNPIIYLDEIDKISETKSKEINGLLTHLLDEEQNNKFQDNYLSNINIDLSKVFFVIAFNHADRVDPIVMDRMKVINIQNPTVEDKIMIIRDKILPELTKHIPQKITIDESLIKYIITEKAPKEDGVRQLKKCFEKMINKLNYQLLVGKIEAVETFDIDQKFIDLCLPSTYLDDRYHFMYT